MHTRNCNFLGFLVRSFSEKLWLQCWDWANHRYGKHFLPTVILEMGVIFRSNHALPTFLFSSTPPVPLSLSLSLSLSLFLWLFSLPLLSASRKPFGDPTNLNQSKAAGL